MTYYRTWRLAVLLAGGMSAAAFADHREDRNKRPYLLTLDALVGPSGTDVVLHVSAPGGQRLPDEAEHVFLWSQTSHGRITWTRHVKDLPLPGGSGVIAGLPIPAHMPLSAMVELKVAGSHRVQILSANTIALDRPDLVISRVDAPAEVRVGQTANIAAVIQEIRGSRGATFSVLLLEGTTVLDTVSGATIDPMGTTTAMFSVRFDAPGTHALTASIVDAVPGEWDTSNNTASFSIRVTDILPVNYSLTYQRSEGEYSSNVTLSMKSSKDAPGYSEVDVTEQGSFYQEIGRHETLNYSAFSGQFVSGTIDFSVTIRIDGARDVTLALSGWTPFSSSGGPERASNAYQVYDPDSNANVYLESQWSAAKGTSTILQYSRQAGDYTYHSSGYNTFWSSVSVTDPATGTVVTTITNKSSSFDNSGTVVIGSFLDAYQMIQVQTVVAFDGGSIGGWTQELPVLMTSVDRTWDDVTTDANSSNHSWGYERRTFWDAQGSGVTAP
jgi:hypothetical protein